MPCYREINVREAAHPALLLKIRTVTCGLGAWLLEILSPNLGSLTSGIHKKPCWHQSLWLPSVSFVRTLQHLYDYDCQAWEGKNATWGCQIPRWHLQRVKFLQVPRWLWGPHWQVLIKCLHIPQQRGCSRRVNWSLETLFLDLFIYFMCMRILPTYIPYVRQVRSQKAASDLLALES